MTFLIVCRSTTQSSWNCEKLSPLSMDNSMSSITIMWTIICMLMGLQWSPNIAVEASPLSCWKREFHWWTWSAWLSLPVSSPPRVHKSLHLKSATLKTLPSPTKSSRRNSPPLTSRVPTPQTASCCRLRFNWKCEKTIQGHFDIEFVYWTIKASVRSVANGKQDAASTILRKRFRVEKQIHEAVDWVVWWMCGVISILFIE